MAFPYEPLQRDEIRVLRLLPARIGDLACFEVVHVSLQSKPAYTALSYTWGQPGDLYAVNLNGRRFPIRQSLHEALKQITSDWKRYTGDRGFLWIDAICINQDTLDPKALDERATQVSLMTSIYTQASKVLIWLGNTENEINNNMAYRLMEYFEKRYRQTLKDARPFRPWWWKKPRRSAATDLSDSVTQLAPTKNKDVFDIPGSNSYRDWLGIVSLWQKPWWSRTWIFQEATIPEKSSITYIRGIGALPSTSKVRFLCGTQECGWDELHGAKVVATSILTAPDAPDHARLLVGTFAQLSRLVVFRSLRVQGGLRNFESTLQMFRHTQCADPRDKLYAPLCLAPEDVRASLKPDYRKDVGEVYKDIARYAIQRKPNPNLDFLGLTFYNPEGNIVTTTLPDGTAIRCELPSWVPNLAHNLAISPIPKILFTPRYEPDRPPSPKFFDGSNLPDYTGPTTSAYTPLSGTAGGVETPTIDGDLLQLRGAHIDNLKDIIKDSGPDLDSLRVIAREKGRQWSAESNNRYVPTGESFVDALHRTSVLDILYNDDGVPAERGAKLDPAFLNKTRAELTVTDYTYQANMQAARNHAFMSRDLGFTTKLYLATIPQTAVVGDEVWALATGRVLYVLRPVDVQQRKRYIFIGECYVNGLMDGQVSRLLSTGELIMEDVVLVQAH